MRYAFGQLIHFANLGIEPATEVTRLRCSQTHGKHIKRLSVMDHSRHVNKCSQKQREECSWFCQGERGHAKQSPWPPTALSQAGGHHSHMLLGCLRGLHATDLEVGHAWPYHWTTWRHLRKVSLRGSSETSDRHFMQSSSAASLSHVSEQWNSQGGHQMTLSHGLRAPEDPVQLSSPPRFMLHVF